MGQGLTIPVLSLHECRLSVAPKQPVAMPEGTVCRQPESLRNPTLFFAQIRPLHLHSNHPLVVVQSGDLFDPNSSILRVPAMNVRDHRSPPVLFRPSVSQFISHNIYSFCSQHTISLGTLL